MIVNIFSIPLIIGNIDCSKIKINNKGFNEKWLSKTKTSFDFKNQLTKESEDYLLNVLSKNLIQFFKSKFAFKINGIWENHYEENDYQEAHIHTNSDFSFIIYKEVCEANTIFLNPLRYQIEANNCCDYFDQKYHPTLRQNQIIVFPSFLEHLVLKNNKSKTISGNILINKNEFN